MSDLRVRVQARAADRIGQGGRGEGERLEFGERARTGVYADMSIAS